MKLLKMSGHDCMLYSMAMLLDEDPAALVEAIGHDGKEVLWPQYKRPYCYRGYHIQEMIDVALDRGIALVSIECYPRSGPAPDPSQAQMLWGVQFSQDRFIEWVTGREALLIGEAKGGGGHACAWDGEIVFDPNGYKYPLEEFTVCEAYLALRLTITSTERNPQKSLDSA